MNIYDSARRIVAERHNGRDITTYKYEPDGRKTKTEFLLPREKGVDVFSPVEGSEQSFGVQGAASMTTTYDANGRAVETLIHDESHSLLSGIVLEYAGNGRLIEERYHVGTKSFLDELPADAENDGRTT